MWSVLKIDKKKLEFLKRDFKEKIGDEAIFYNPKILIQKYKKNKLFSKEYSLLGDYIFCYQKKFKSNKFLDLIKFSRGLKYFLNTTSVDQNEIINFINKCKRSEDKDGNLTNQFFEYSINSNYKFKSGPMTDKLFKLIEIHKNKLKILLGGYKTTINKKDYLFHSV